MSSACDFLICEVASVKHIAVEYDRFDIRKFERIAVTFDDESVGDPAAVIFFVERDLRIGEKRCI